MGNAKDKKHEDAGSLLSDRIKVQVSHPARMDHQRCNILTASLLFVWGM